MRRVLASLILIAALVVAATDGARRPVLDVCDSGANIVGAGPVVPIFAD